MTKQVQRRRGTATQHTSFTGAEGELSVNTTNKSVHVHDNVTAGGFEAARVDMDNVTSSSILTAAGITATTTELNYVDGVTSAIQTQIDGKAGTASPTFTGTLTTANLTATGTTTLAGASTSADITFGDNDKAIFGAGSDLSIFHNGSASIIEDSGTGGITLRSNLFTVQNAAGTETVAQFVEDGFVKLFHNNSQVFTTTSTGIDVTGTVTADGLTVDGAATIVGNTSPASDEVLLNLASLNGTGTAGNMLRFTDTDPTAINNGSIGKIQFYSEDTDAVVAEIEGQNADASPDGRLLLKTAEGTTLRNRLKISNNGDISFYEDTGTTAKFFWDASSENLGIGTSSPNGLLELSAGDGGGTLNIVSTVNAVNSGNKIAFFAANRSDTDEEMAYIKPLLVANNGGSGNVQEGHLTFGTSGSEAMRIDSSQNLLVGTTSTSISNEGAVIFPSGVMTITNDGGRPLRLNRKTSDGNILQFDKDGIEVGSIGANAGSPYFTTTDGGFRIAGNGALQPATSTGAVSDALEDLGSTAGRWRNLHLSGTGYVGTSLGIGTSSPARTLEVYSSAPAIKLNNGTNAFTIGTGAFVDGSNSLVFFDEGVGERMRLDASGNLLVGGITTLPSSSVNGFGVLPTGIVVAAVSNDKVTVFKRNGSDGDISLFQKNATTVGSIGTLGGHTYIGGPSASGLYFGGSRVQPMSSGSLADNLIDMGHPTYRFDDIYATNGTIQTSDRNEKQDIAELSEAEQRVAVAAKGLLRKFRWKDAVAEKGDEARTHFGIIAQDLQAAFAAEGLDAGDYAMFISSTWTDEETGEERTRMGVRYSELLAFIIAAI